MFLQGHDMSVILKSVRKSPESVTEQKRPELRTTTAGYLKWWTADDSCYPTYREETVSAQQNSCYQN